MQMYPYFINNDVWIRETLVLAAKNEFHSLFLEKYEKKNQYSVSEIRKHEQF